MTDLLRSVVTVIDVFYKYTKQDGECDTLSKNELKELLEKEFRPILKNPDDPDTVDVIMHMLDRDHDRRLDFTEFLLMVFKLAMACNKVLSKEYCKASGSKKRRHGRRHHEEESETEEEEDTSGQKSGYRHSSCSEREEHGYNSEGSRGTAKHRHGSSSRGSGDGGRQSHASGSSNYSGCGKSQTASSSCQAGRFGGQGYQSSCTQSGYQSGSSRGQGHGCLSGGQSSGYGQYEPRSCSQSSSQKGYGSRACGGQQGTGDRELLMDSQETPPDTAKLVMDSPLGQGPGQLAGRNLVTVSPVTARGIRGCLRDTQDPLMGRLDPNMQSPHLPMDTQDLT
nr:filaggrin-2-like isoform X3 [Vicugna pacos]